ncbi:MAG: hypothetical protein LBG96_06485 [Tannerella sp.]|nr:hypothetical protein [Tannerella sp.]
MGFLALLRVKNLEQSQTIPAGELGRCMGIDRIPEVKTLRERIAAFCRETLRRDEKLHRYMLVFDRECYSVEFFKNRK